MPPRQRLNKILIARIRERRKTRSLMIKKPLKRSKLKLSRSLQVRNLATQVLLTRILGPALGKTAQSLIQSRKLRSRPLLGSSDHASYFKY